MPTPTAIAQRLYEAMAHADGQALFGLLTDDFVGTVSTGMPHGLGRAHPRPFDMIAGSGARIAPAQPLEHRQLDPTATRAHSRQATMSRSAAVSVPMSASPTR